MCFRVRLCFFVLKVLLANISCPVKNKNSPGRRSVGRRRQPLNVLRTKNRRKKKTRTARSLPHYVPFSLARPLCSRLPRPVFTRLNADRDLLFKEHAKEARPPTPPHLRRLSSLAGARGQHRCTLIRPKKTKQKTTQSVVLCASCMDDDTPESLHTYVGYMLQVLEVISVVKPRGCPRMFPTPHVAAATAVAHIALVFRLLLLVVLERPEHQDCFVFLLF